jgi:hypothetical protein
MSKNSNELERLIDDLSGVSSGPPTGDCGMDMDELSMEVTVYNPPEKKDLKKVDEKFEEDLDKNTVEDYNYARESMLHLIKQGNEMLSGALEFTNEVPSSRSIEVTSGLLKNLGDLHEKLMKVSIDLQKSRGTMAKKPTQKAENIQNNFYGSPEEMLRASKERDLIKDISPDD